MSDLIELILSCSKCYTYITSYIKPVSEVNMFKFGEYGEIRINLDKLIEKSGLSKNKFSRYAEMERTQLNRYINNDVVLLNKDVLARMCTVLECDISDILEYVPPESEKK